MPTRPPYVPVGARYVNPDGRPSERRHWSIVAAGAVLVAIALFFVVLFVVTGARNVRPPAEPGFTTMPAAGVPATYGPPPAGPGR